MNIKKNSKGITLIVLIITVIIMLILVSVSTYTGLESYNRAARTEFISMMQLVQAKVDELVKEKDLNPEALGKDLGENELKVFETAISNGEISGKTTDTLRYFSKDELKEQLEIEVNEEIIVDFSTREVISLNGVKYKGKIYYTQYNLPKGQKLIQYSNNDQENELNFTYSKTNQRLNATIKIIPTRKGNKIENAIIKYKLGEEQYRQINKDTITISKSGTYIVQVSDIYGTKPIEKDINVQLTNSPMLIKNWSKITTNSETTFEEYTDSDKITWYDYAEDEFKKYAYAKDEEGNYYIWIPRYAKNNESGEIKFIKGNSNTFTDETAYNSYEWTIPKEFSPNNIKLTGFWLRVQEPNSQSIDLYLTNINKDDIVYAYE